MTAVVVQPGSTRSAGKFRRRGLQPLAGPSLAGRFRNAHACQTPSVESRGLLILHELAAAWGCARHSLQLPLLLPCGQMPTPPQSLHRLLCLPCGQMLLPPHSLHMDLFLPCGQMLLPLQSLHWCLFLPCVQMPLPLHSLHMDLFLPWKHMLAPQHSLHLYFLLPCGQFLCTPDSGTILTSVEDAGVAPTDRHARLRQQWHRTRNNQTCCAMHNVRSAVAPRANCAVPHRACYVGILWTPIVHFEVTGLRADVLCDLRGVRRHIHTR